MFIDVGVNILSSSVRSDISTCRPIRGLLS
jgi:hypothetical protein